MVKSAVRRRRFEEVQPLLLPPPPSLLALGGDGVAESPPLDAAPLLISMDPNASFANEHADTTTTMAPSILINDARLAAPDWVDLTTTTTTNPSQPADETTNWEEETATSYLDETKLSEEAAAAASEAPDISDPAVGQEDQEGDSFLVTPLPEEEAAGGTTNTETIDTEGTPTTTTTTSTAIPAEQQPLPTATVAPKNEKITPPPIYQEDPIDAAAAATRHPQPQPNTRPEQLNTTALGVLVALIFVLLLCWCCRRRRRDGWDTSRGQYRAVANQYASNQYDDAFADDLSDYEDDDDDGEVLDDGGDDSSYNGNGKMIELKDMKKDRGRLSLQEMNG